uniref:Ig-like domain-containing protein n=1 Tax=Eptatretus burgeri TaxID=7764 RepID=A0A8C4N2P6_EPTBU
MFSPLFVCLSVCLFVNSISQKVCTDSLNINPKNTIIVWKHLNGTELSLVHYSYEGVNSLENQEPRYNDRTSLPDESKICHGNVSLILTAVRKHDEGKYSCSPPLIIPHPKPYTFLPPLILPKPTSIKFPAFLPESPCGVHLVYPVYPAPSLSLPQISCLCSPLICASLSYKRWEGFH